MLIFATFLYDYIQRVVILMIKNQWIGEFTLDENIPTVRVGVDNLYHMCMEDMGAEAVEIHQILQTGKNDFTVIMNFEK